MALKMYQAALFRVGDTEEAKNDKQQIEEKIQELTKTRCDNSISNIVVFIYMFLNEITFSFQS
jgi:hypothetical protein